MDQIKIGTLLKALRKEKGVTQEQLAEHLGVSNRSVSRWETGANLPDFDLLMELASYYEIGIDELLNGERKEAQMDKKTEELMLKVSEYDNESNIKQTRRMHYVYILGAVFLVLYLILHELGLTDTVPYSNISGFSIGVALGIMISGIIFTSRYASRLKAFKRRLLLRNDSNRQER